MGGISLPVWGVRSSNVDGNEAWMKGFLHETEEHYD
jgi:hypothetical protein